jgi:MFS family permease
MNHVMLRAEEALPVLAAEQSAARVLPAARPASSWQRALALLWLGQVVSHLGDSLYLVGIFYLALEVTGSKPQSGFLLAVNFVPALALGLFAGAFVDRHDRQKMMIAADLLRAVAVGSIPLLYAAGQLTPAVLGIAIFLLATGATVFNPAMKALVPEIAPAAHLTTAAAVFQISEFAALVAGPALARWFIVPRLGSRHLFSIDAATFLFEAICVSALPAAARRAAHRRAAPASSGVIAEVVAGLRVVLATPVLRLVLVLVALDNLLMTGLTLVASPLLVKERLGLGTDAYAGSQAFLNLGMVAASTLFWILGRRSPKGITILTGVILDGLTFIPLAFCHTLAQVQVAMFFHALAVPLMIIPRTVLVQELVPGPLHGRAFALLNVTVFGMTAISVGLTGLLANRFALQTLFVVLGAAGALAGLVGFALGRLRAAR